MKDEEKKVSKNKLDIEGLNVIIGISKKIFKIGYVILIILGIYAFIKLGKEMGVFKTILSILKVISPLFVGIVIAWLFNPMIKWLEKKKVRRSLATTAVFIVFIGLLVLIVGTFIPTLYTQVQDFASTVPNIMNKLQKWFVSFINSFDGIAGINVANIKTEVLTKIENLGTSLVSGLPETIIAAVSSFFSGVGIFVVGLIIAFFLLLSFEDMNQLIGFLPKKAKKVTKELLDEIDGALRTFVTGSIIDCLLIFVITSIGLSIVGLKAPLLFGLFCGITNIIPYAGPYIGGIPAVVVGFSQGITTGILTLIVIGIIQFLEGNFLQPVILSKTTKLHPVTIMLGLLVGGHLWGIPGMVISTPIIAAIKAVVLYFDKKYDILKFD